jgi:hypothetical protein
MGPIGITVVCPPSALERRRQHRLWLHEGFDLEHRLRRLNRRDAQPRHQPPERRAASASTDGAVGRGYRGREPDREAVGIDVGGSGACWLRRDHPDRRRKADRVITILLIIIVIVLLAGGGIGMRRRGR